jgi:hypothetical protein
VAIDSTFTAPRRPRRPPRSSSYWPIFPSRRRPRALAAALLPLWIVASGGPALALDETAGKAAFQAAEIALAAHSDGFSLDGEPKTSSLLTQLWSIAGRWAVDFINEHPSATTAELTASIRTLSPQLGAAAVKLDPRTFLVSMHSGEIGTVLIIAERGHRFEIAWTIADDTASRPRDFDVIAAWSADRALDRCRQHVADEAWATCGPLFATTGALPDERDGSHRFFVSGTYAQPMGATVSAQLSLWRWTGGTAVPLLARIYGYMIDQEHGIRVDGDILHVGIKGEFKTFTVCGACDGRQMDWTIRVGPDGIEDLGEASLVPELDLIDTLLDRLIKQEPTTDIAAPAVARALAATIAQVRKDAARSGYPPSLGMLMGWKATTRGQQRRLCLSTDSGGTYLFAIDTIQGKPRLSAAENLGDAECES